MGMNENIFNMSHNRTVREHLTVTTKMTHGSCFSLRSDAAAAEVQALTKTNLYNNLIGKKNSNSECCCSRLIPFSFITLDTKNIKVISLTPILIPPCT